MQLRDYQLDIINKVRASMSSGCKHNLIVSPTGSGKTALTAHMIKSAADKGKSALFIVHRRELIKQSAAAFDAVGINYGIISSDFPERPFAPVQIASMQTLTRRLNKLVRVPDLVIHDEAHHIAAKNWSNLFHHFDKSYHIGLTATPRRLDGKGLGNYFKNMVEGITTAELIKSGYLADYKYFAGHSLDLTSVHTQMGDYKKSELAGLVTENQFVGNAVNEYKKHALGKRAVVFCVNIDHATIMRRKFLDAGIPTAHLDGETPTHERDQTIDKFKCGEIHVLTNVDLFGEGFDLPAIECVILLRATQSLSLFLQQVGRSLRPSPGKSHAIIIDHVGNLNRHGLPDDERAWTLDDKKKKDPEPNNRICPKCYAAARTNVYICANCGEPLTKPSVPRDPKYLNEDETELKEIDKSARPKKIDLARASAKTEADLVELAVSRGYKSPHRWAHHIFQARQRKKLGIK